MAEVSEKCSCGAEFKWNGNGDSHDSVLSIFENWRANHRHSKDEPKKPEPHPAGNNFSSVERKHDSTPHELDTETGPLWRYSAGISLKWHPAP